MTGGPPPQELRSAVLRDPVHWVAFGFGLGLLPRAPGTFGSLLGIPLWWLTHGQPVLQGGVAVAAVLAGIWVCGESARRIGLHDHGGIVWDEVAGMYLTLLAVPPEPAWILAAFVLFRIMDIWKPWPIRELDHRLGGGLGIMLDDIVAALFAAILLLFFRFLV